MKIQDLANFVCEKIPLGWELYLTLERGCGVWLLIDPDGNPVSVPGTDAESSLEDSGLLALRYAEFIAPEWTSEYTENGWIGGDC